MTVREIAIFKWFLIQNTTRDLFIRKYRGEAGSMKNPHSIEAYLSNVSHTDVIKKAFSRFKINSAFGFDFWDKINDDWLLYYKRTVASNSFCDDERLYTFKGMFTPLRENWDSNKPWVYESETATRVRYGLDVPEKVFVNKPEPQKEEPAETVAPEIEFIDITNVRKSGKLDKGMMSVNVKLRSARCTVNRSDSIDITRKKLTKARMGRMGSEVVIQFNTSAGVGLAVNKEHYVSVNSTDFTRKLHSLLSLTEELSYVRMEKISEKEDSLTFKITAR